ncbi:MAG: DsrE family protein [Myxococcota bacterium]|nr:DsrE family protein [Myxococcota bacterium]
MSNLENVVVILTTGKQDRGARATLAFGWACTALAMGQSVTIFMTMEGTIWALKDATKDVKVEGFEPLDEYLSQFIDLGGELLACAPCSEYYCSFDPTLVRNNLHPNVQLAGLSTVVSKAISNASVVTF